MTKAQNYIGGDTAQIKCTLKRKDTAHKLLMRGAIGVGTLHNIERKSLVVSVSVWVGGWVGGEGGKLKVAIFSA